MYLYHTCTHLCHMCMSSSFRLCFEVILGTALCSENKTCTGRDRAACVVSVRMPCLAYTLPSLYLVPVVFDTAIPTFLNIFGACFLYLRVYSLCCAIVH